MGSEMRGAGASAETRNQPTEDPVDPDALRDVPVYPHNWRLTMKITRSGSRPSTIGPATWFTGTVRIDPLFAPDAPSAAGGNAVTFEPGARTAWHTHPLGQTVIVTFGRGWAQREGGPVEEILPGDVVIFPPGEKHWHGASDSTAMQHIAINEAVDSRAVDWLEHVTDEEYQRGPAAR